MEMEKQRVVAKAKRKERKKKRAETALEKKSASAVKVEVFTPPSLHTQKLYLYFQSILYSPRNSIL